MFGCARWCICGAADILASGTFSTKSNRCQLPLGFLREAVLFKSAKRGERLRNQATGKSICAPLSLNQKSHLLSGAWVKLDHKTQFPGWSNWDDVGVGSNVFFERTKVMIWDTTSCDEAVASSEEGQKAVARWRITVGVNFTWEWSPAGFELTSL